jgi:hypothetical protein
MNNIKDGVLHLDVTGAGLASLWDTEEQARRSGEGVYVALRLTNEQHIDLVLAQAKAVQVQFAEATK